MSKSLPVKQIILDRGLTLAEVARAVGCNSNDFRAIVNGTRASWPALRARLSEYLGESELTLFDLSSATDAALDKAARIIATALRDAEAKQAKPVKKAAGKIAKVITDTTGGTKTKPAAKKTASSKRRVS